MCAGRLLVAGVTDLVTTHLELAAQWYYEGNWPLKPTDVTAISKRKVWWRADCGHMFKVAVKSRAGNKRLTCPYCTGRKKVARPVR